MAGFLAPVVGTALGTLALNLISGWLANSTMPKAAPQPKLAGHVPVPQPNGITRWLNLATGKYIPQATLTPQPGKPSFANVLSRGVKGGTGALLGAGMSVLPMALMMGATTAGTGAAVAGPVANTGLKMAFRLPGALMPPQTSATKRELFGDSPGDVLRQLGTLADDTNGIGQGIAYGGQVLGSGMSGLATQMQLANIHRQLMGDTNSLGTQLKGMGLTPAELRYMEQVMRTMNPVGRPTLGPRF